MVEHCNPGIHGNRGKTKRVPRSNAKSEVSEIAENKKFHPQQLRSHFVKPRLRSNWNVSTFDVRLSKKRLPAKNYPDDRRFWNKTWCQWTSNIRRKYLPPEQRKAARDLEKVSIRQCKTDCSVLLNSIYVKENIYDDINNEIVYETCNMKSACFFHDVPSDWLNEMVYETWLRFIFSQLLSMSFL